MRGRVSLRRDPDGAPAGGWDLDELRGLQDWYVRYALTSADGVVKLEFAGGPTFVLNRQTAAHQMWFAAGASAWHYEWSEEAQAWRCDKDGHDLLARIGEVTSERLGRAVSL